MGYTEDLLLNHLTETRQRLVEAGAELVTMEEDWIAERIEQEQYVESLKSRITAIEQTLVALGVAIP